MASTSGLRWRAFGGGEQIGSGLGQPPLNADDLHAQLGDGVVDVMPLLFQRDYALLEFLEGAHGLLSAGVVGLVKVENVADLGQLQAQAFAAQDEL